MQKTRFNS